MDIMDTRHIFYIAESWSTLVIKRDGLREDIVLGSEEELQVMEKEHVAKCS